MASPSKAAHYTQQLHATLLRGAWHESNPGRAPNGSILSWSELLRKYRKHTSNDDFANVASATQALALLVIPSQASSTPVTLTPETLDADVSDSAAPLKLGGEGMLADERKEEAEGALEALGMSNEKSPFRESIHLARAHFAFSLGNPSECLSILSHVTLDGPRRTDLSPRTSIEAKSPATNGSNVTSDRSSSVTGGSIGTAKSIADPNRATAIWWTTERIRARCQEGMSYESLNKVSSALQAYDSGFTLLESLDAMIFTMDEKAQEASFKETRELWRWAERLLRRRSVVASRRFAVDAALPYLKAYREYAQRWPPGFRATGCGLIHSLHLRALCISTPFPRTTNLTISNNVPRVPSPYRTQWYRDAQESSGYYQRVLDAQTTFPRAGEQNVEIHNFVDLCMAVWERGGCIESEAGWVIEIMWWATRLTFHSQRIMRHLTRLLLARGEYAEAKRTFLLYVQLVVKGRETSAGDVSLQLKRRPTDLPAEHPDVIADEEESDEGGAGGDSDDDAVFLSMLLLGVRMLCRYGDGEDVIEAKRVMDIALEVLGAETSQTRRRWSSSARASLLTSRGILNARLVDFEHEATRRPTLLAEARDFLVQATELDPTSSSAFWHLATVQSALRDVDGAVVSARHAVELAPADVRAWHLLGLLLTAQEEWEKALEILELGMVKTQPEAEADTDGPPLGNGNGNGTTATEPGEGVTSHDFANGTAEGSSSPKSPPPTTTSSIVGTRTETLPSPRLLQYQITSVPFMRTAERFEASVQMLLTQLALSERFEGAERANERWPDVFVYFSSYCPSGPPNPSTTTSFEQIASHPETVNSNTDGVPRIEVVVPSSPTIADHAHASAAGSQHHQRNRLSVHKRLLNGNNSLNPLHRRRLARHDSIASSQQPPRPNSYASSAPDLHAPEYYQASSIHSRRRSPVGSSFNGHGSSGTPERSLSPTAPSPYSNNNRTASENRLLSEIWLTSAATFRRMGRIDQAKGAIMEAEVLDEENPNVWVQYALYLLATGEPEQAIESLSKALIIDPDNVTATVHLAQLFLSPSAASKARIDPASANDTVVRESIDLAAGMLDSFTRRAVGWNIAEAWYFLGKAAGLQGRKERQRECLAEAIRLEEGRPIRSVSVAFLPCL